MAVEVEAKVKVDDLDAVRRQLAEVGAVFIRSVRERNTYLATANEDEGLRVRHEVGENHVRTRITFKGPRQAGRMKRREEIEIDVDDAASSVKIFERLGHGVTLQFEKDRETWTLDGCEVVLDRLPLLGTFVEVEGADEAAIDAVLRRLDLHELPTIGRGYASMLYEAGGGERIFSLD
jgi:predicted adenylyl cyclase CyaB